MFVVMMCFAHRWVGTGARKGIDRLDAVAREGIIYFFIFLLLFLSFWKKDKASTRV